MCELKVLRIPGVCWIGLAPRCSRLPGAPNCQALYRALQVGHLAWAAHVTWSLKPRGWPLIPLQIGASQSGGGRQVLDGLGVAGATSFVVSGVVFICITEWHNWKCHHKHFDTPCRVLAQNLCVQICRRSYTTILYQDVPSCMHDPSQFGYVWIVIRDGPFWVHEHLPFGMELGPISGNSLAAIVALLLPRICANPDFRSPAKPGKRQEYCAGYVAQHYEELRVR